jgi:hypothetical protein
MRQKAKDLLLEAGVASVAVGLGVLAFFLLAG